MYYGPVPLWWWSGERLDAARLCWQVDRFLEGGVEEAVVISLAPSGPNAGAFGDDPPYFSDPWWEIFLEVGEYAKRRGFGLWFYDQIGFSGAHFQAHIVAAWPGAAGWRLDRAGTAPGSRGVRPVGDGFVAVRDGFDYLSREACRRLIDAVHGEFERRAGHLFGTVVRGSFQDELASMPTWSARFPGEFAARRRYRLEPHLGSLWGGDDTRSRQVRRDYQLTRAELAEEAFFRPLYQWHHERGLQQGCDQQEPARRGHPAAGVRYYADYPRTHRWLSAPGCDHWGEAKIHSSLAHAYRRPRVWVEAFHGTGWGGTVEETFDWLVPWLRAGANLYDPHAAYYATAQSRFEWSPPSTCWRQPYWSHYRHFARTVAGLSRLVAEGTHVCDVAVLHPVSTVQQELPLTVGEAEVFADSHVSKDPPPVFPEAHQAYEALVGAMTWQDFRPGALDRARVDFDVLDEPSVARASVVDGALELAGERYPTVVLPATRALEPETARRLCELVEAGGRLVAVGTLPTDPAGYRQDASPLKALRELFDAGSAVSLPTVEDVAAWLDAQPRRVRAGVPTLLRRYDDGSNVLLIPATFPMATRVDPGWPAAGYDFDPARWAGHTEVSVTGEFSSAELLDPETGARQPLPARRTGDGLAVTVRFDGPIAAVVLREAPPQPVPTALPDLVEVCSLELPWHARPVQTIDNRWGDFPPVDPDPVQVWRLEHDPGDGRWRTTRAAYGTWAVRSTVGPVAALPGPARPALAAALARSGLDTSPEWAPVSWSFRYGGVGDPEAEFRLGRIAGTNRGFVPDGFLPLGRLRPGEGVVLRTVLDVPAGGAHVLEVGAPARVTAWVDGRQAGGPSAGYWLACPVETTAGRHLVELRFEAATTEPVLASFAWWPAPAWRPHPRWLRADPGTITDGVLRHRFAVAEAPTTLPLLFASRGVASIRLNGVELARHGEYDNYRAIARHRVVEYDAAAACRPGDNLLEVVLGDGAAVLLDGLLPGGERLITDPDRWDGGHTDHRMAGWDPRPLSLARAPYPHPLPDLAGPVPPARPVPAGRAAVERLRVRLPPGAVRVRVPATTRFTVVEPAGAVVEDQQVRLPRPASGGDVLVLAFPEPAVGTGGALLAGPVTVAVETGPVRLGDWAEQGLADFSGALEYHTTVALDQVPRRPLLDLGRVRGTAEVHVNDQPAGVRLWTPYRFDVDGLLVAGDNRVRITVHNTIAPYLAAVNPAAWVYPEQEVSGLFGPVRLLAGPPRAG